MASGIKITRRVCLFKNFERRRRCFSSPDEFDATLKADRLFSFAAGRVAGCRRVQVPFRVGLGRSGEVMGNMQGRFRKVQGGLR